MATKYITVIATNGSGAPEYYAEVKVYLKGFAGGSFPSKRTDRDGKCDFELDLGDHDKISLVAYNDGRRGETDWDYPSAYIRVVLR